MSVSQENNIFTATIPYCFIVNLFIYKVARYYKNERNKIP